MVNINNKYRHFSVNKLKVIDNKGFTMIELILSIVLTSIALYAAINYFFVDTKISTMQYNLVNQVSSTQTNNIRNLIHYGRLNEDGSVATGIPDTQANQKFVFKSSYMTADNTARICTLDYDKANKNIIFYENNDKSTAQVLVKNVSVFNITYKNLKDEEVTDSSLIRLVVLDINYTQNGEEKTTKIISKLMQES